MGIIYWLLVCSRSDKMFHTSSVVYQLFPVLKLLCAIWILWITHLLNSVLWMIRFIIVMGVYPLSALFQLPCPVWWLLSFGWWWGATEVHHQSGHLPTPAPAHSQYLVRSMLCVQSFVNVFVNQFCCKFFLYNWTLVPVFWTWIYQLQWVFQSNFESIEMFIGCVF